VLCLQLAELNSNGYADYHELCFRVLSECLAFPVNIIKMQSYSVSSINKLPSEVIIY